MLENLKNASLRALNTTGIKLKQHSPAILAGVAIVAGAGAIYFACKSSHDGLDNVLLEAEARLDEVKERELQVAQGLIAEEAYTRKDATVDRLKVKCQTVVKLGRLYAPTIALGAVSATCTLSAVHILSARNAALVSSYAALDKYVRDYQNRVAMRFGEDVERRIRFDIHDDDEDIVEHNDETGEDVVIKKKTEDVMHTNAPDCFIFSDETSPLFRGDLEHDEFFCLQAEEYANKVLESRRTNTKPGYYFLSELLDSMAIDYDAAGISRTEAHLKGWILPCKNEAGVESGVIHHISLGIGDWLDHAKRDMDNDATGYLGIIICLNLDGVIVDKI